MPPLKAPLTRPPMLVPTTPSRDVMLLVPIDDPGVRHTPSASSSEHKADTRVYLRLGRNGSDE